MAVPVKHLPVCREKTKYRRLLYDGGVLFSDGGPTAVASCSLQWLFVMFTHQFTYLWTTRTQNLHPDRKQIQTKELVFPEKSSVKA